MAIMVLYATPNADGLTANAVKNMVEGLREGGAEVDLCNLHAEKLSACRTCGDGWGKCKEEGRCVLQDGFAAVYERAVKADALVWITPVYWHDLSESMKCFVDRLRRCETAKNRFLAGKKDLLVACAGGSGRGATLCLFNMEEAMNHMGMVTVDRLPVIRFNREYMLPAVKKAGETFAKAVAEKE